MLTHITPREIYGRSKLKNIENPSILTEKSAKLLVLQLRKKWRLRKQHLNGKTDTKCPPSFFTKEISTIILIILI